jgi:hypothetical protein
MGKASGDFPDPAQVAENFTEQLKDPTGEALIADMDEAGVDVSVIFPLDYSLGADEPPSEALDEIGPWRVMYGTDNPYLRFTLSSK